MSQAETSETSWKQLYRLGGVAALISFAVIPLAVVVFVAWPPPSFQPTSSAVSDWFKIFQDNAFRGVLDGDLLLMIAQVAFVPLLLALYAALRKVNQPFMAVALALGVIGVTASLASNPSFSLLSLSAQYASATDPALRSQLVAAGQALLATYQGTPYVMGYVLQGLAMLVSGTVMLRGSIFGRRTAYVGIAAGVLSLVPANAGTAGLVFSFSSLIPIATWDILLARRLFQLGRSGRGYDQQGLSASALGNGS